MSTVSYTFRIPEELKRLIDSAAESAKQSVASFIVGACWAQVESYQRRGEAQKAEQRPPKPKAARSIRATPAKLSVHKVGEALVNPNAETLADSRSYLVQTKEVDIAELRKICAGEIVKPDADYSEPPAEPAPVRVCMSCLEPMREVKGKWACMDVSCGMYGREQNHRKMLTRA